MLDFRIDTFLTVCKHMNYTKAAQELNITQPGVTQHIRYLEDYYGIRLFDYKNRKLTLTPEGAAFKSAITTMKINEGHLKARLLALSHPERPLSLGLTLTVSEYAIPKALGSYLNHHPDINANIVVNNTEHLLQKLDNGELDVAIVEGYFNKTEYDFLLYEREPFICVCSGKRECKKNYQIEDLTNERLICREQGSGTRDILTHFLTEHNMTLDSFEHLVEINNMNVIKKLVAADNGISFMYEKAVKTELENGTLQKMAIKNMNISHDFTYIWRKGSLFSEEYKALYKQLKL